MLCMFYHNKKFRVKNGGWNMLGVRRELGIYIMNQFTTQITMCLTSMNFFSQPVKEEGSDLK